MFLIIPSKKLAPASREASTPHFNIVQFSEYGVEIKWFAFFCWRAHKKPTNNANNFYRTKWNFSIFQIDASI